MDNHVQQAAKKLTARRGFSLHYKKGAVRLEVYLVSPSTGLPLSERALLQDVAQYRPQEEPVTKSFWLSKAVSCRFPLLTIHHGFEMDRYISAIEPNGMTDAEVDAKAMEQFRDDVMQIVACLEEDHGHGLMHTIKMQTLKSKEVLIYEPNFELKEKERGEGDYWTVLLLVEPSQELKYIHETLYKAFPHTRMFPDWSVHIASVADKESADILKERLQNVEIQVAPRDLIVDFIMNNK